MLWPSMALRRLLPVVVGTFFWLMCGVTPLARKATTRSAVWYALSSSALMRCSARFTLSLSDAVRGAAFHGAVRLADLAGDRRAFPQRLQGDRRPQRCINFPSCPFAHGLLRPSIEWQSGRPPTTLPFQMPGPFRFGCPSELASPCARRPRQHAGRDGRMVRPGAEPKNVAI